MPKNKNITIKQATTLTGFCGSHVSTACRNKKIAAVKDERGRWQIDQLSLLEWVVTRRSIDRLSLLEWVVTRRSLALVSHEPIAWGETATSADGLLSITEAARKIGCSRSLIKQMITTGELTATKVGYRWVVATTDLKSWGAKPRPKPGPRPKPEDKMQTYCPDSHPQPIGPSTYIGRKRVSRLRAMIRECANEPIRGEALAAMRGRRKGGYISELFRDPTLMGNVLERLVTYYYVSDLFD